MTDHIEKPSYRADVRPNMIKDRDLGEFLGDLAGLESVVQYIKTLSSNLVIDVGCGAGLATKQLQEAQFMEGLHIVATNMPDDPSFPIAEENLGKVNVLPTSVEELTGIADASVACILGVHSISYSDNPFGAIDRVLIPGGVIKASFKSSNDDSPSKEHTADRFVQQLQERGYGYAILKNYKSGGNTHDIVVAVKPGGPLSTDKAHKLFDRMMSTLSQQMFSKSSR